MKFLVFISPRDFRDESLSTIKMFFDRWNVKYHLTSYSTKDCVGQHGATYKLDINTNKVDASEYDGIILVDGRGVESYKLYEFRPLLDLILRFNNDKRYIGAIGNAIAILARASVLKNKKVSMPNDKNAVNTITLFHGIPSDEEIEISENIITISGVSSIAEPIQKVLEYIGVK